MAITWYKFEVGVSPEVLGWIWQAMSTRRIQINPTVAIVFRGSPVPILSEGADYIEIRWSDKVEVELPKVTDPDIKYIRIYRGHALIFLAVGNVRADFTNPIPKDDADVLHRT